jgi:hypothetical protein
MKIFVTAALLLGFTFLVATPIQVTNTTLLSRQTEQVSSLDLHPHVLMRLLHVVAKEFDMNMHDTRELYELGEITITLVDVNGIEYYMLAYDGYCILVALEDNF